MSTRRRIGLILVAISIVLIIFLIFVVPRLIDVDRYRPEVIARIEYVTGKRTEIGHLGLTFLPALAIRADNFALANPVGFPRGNLMTARRIYAEVDAAALWRRQLVLKAVELDAPVFSLLTDARGNHNYDGGRLQAGPHTGFRAVMLRGREASWYCCFYWWRPSNAGILRFAQNHKRASQNDTPAWTLGTISKLSLRDGQLTATTLFSSGEAGAASVEIRDASLTLEQIDFDALSYSRAAALAIAITTPLHRLIPSSAFAYDARTEVVAGGKGTFRAATLRFGGLEANEVKAVVQLGPRRLFFPNLSFEFYAGHATGDLAIDFSKPNLRYAISTRLREVDMIKLLAGFPKVSGKMTGTMEASLDLSAESMRSSDPLAGKQGTGQITIRQGRLPTVRLDKKLLELARLGDLGPASGDPTSFSSISADLSISGQQIRSRKIRIVGNGVDVDASGSLTLAGEGSVNYGGVARIRAGPTPLAGILAGLSGAKLADGTLYLPFSLVGKPENPQFVLRVPGR